MAPGQFGQNYPDIRFFCQIDTMAGIHENAVAEEGVKEQAAKRARAEI